MQFEVATKKSDEVVDITERVERVIPNGFSGLCHLFVTHTTTALSVADLDPGTDKDMLRAFREMMPDLDYNHPHDPEHVPDHILSTLIGPGVSVPVINGSLVLGTWQRVVLFEFSGPRKRDIHITFVEGSHA